LKAEALAPAAGCLLAAALFGASTPVARALLEGVGPVTLAGLFYLGAAIGVAPWALRGPSMTRDRRELGRLAGAVLFGGALGPVLVLLGQGAAPAASVSLWLNLEAPSTALLGWAFFGEQVSPRAWAAAGLVWLSSVALASPQGFHLGPSAALVAGGCLCWALDNHLTAVIRDITPAQTTAVKGLGAGLVNLALGMGLEGGLPAWPVLGLSLLVGSLSYGASIVLYVAGAQKIGATTAQMIFATAPFWGVGLAWLALGESPTGAQGLAALGMVGALVLLFR
jgi:drug/metabolite transporter (DMT)-like permease